MDINTSIIEMIRGNSPDTLISLRKLEKQYYDHIQYVKKFDNETSSFIGGVFLITFTNLIISIRGARIGFTVSPSLTIFSYGFKILLNTLIMIYMFYYGGKVYKKSEKIVFNLQVLAMKMTPTKKNQIKKGDISSEVSFVEINLKYSLRLNATN
jgi:hypothetical protein